MMDFFGFGKKYFVGVDFGTSVIKIVELSYQKNRVQLENYGWVETGINFEDRSKNRTLTFTFEERLKVYLKELVRRMNLHSKSVLVSIPAYAGLISIVEFPDMAHDELERAIKFEARKHIPTSLEEVSFSWDIVGTDVTPSGAKRLRIALVAAPQKEVVKYEGLVSSAGLNVDVVELETFSLVRGLVGSDPGTFLIIDIGARATNIILVEKGIIQVNRNIDVGGYDITDTIADSLNISKTRAEALKKEKSDFLNSNEMSLIVPSLELISNEAIRIINLSKEKRKDLKIDSVILSGGSSRMRGLDTYFSKSLGVSAVMGNSFKKIIVDPKIEPIISGQLSTSFTVAVGLAFRGIEDLKSK